MNGSKPPLTQSSLKAGFRPLRVRLVSFVGAALIICTALWVADVRIGFVDVAQWKQEFRDWWRKDWIPEKDPRRAIPPQLPTPVVPTDVAAKVPLILPGTDSSIPETPQSMVLVSTARGRSVREGTAQIGMHAESPQTYVAGALLANGAQILEIHDDHIVLARAGKRADLYLASSGKKSNSDLFMVGGEAPQHSVPLASSYREILTDYIRPSPVFEGQIIKGYEVYAGSRSGVFSQLGLRNGDIVVSLDNQPFTDPKQAIELFRKLTTGIAMSATLERSGKLEQVSLDGAAIAADQERVKNPPQAPAFPAGPGM